MKTQRCHLLTCSLFLLTCIQPAKAMEKDGQNWKKNALIGGTALTVGTLGAIIWAYRHHAPAIQEPSEMLAIRTDLARLGALIVQPDKTLPKFAIRLAQLNTALNFNPTAKDPDWLQKHPTLTAAALTHKHCNYLLALKNKSMSVHALCKQTAALMYNLVTSQEILNEAKDTGNYYE